MFTMSAHLLVGDVLDGVIVLTKQGDSIFSCGNVKDLDQVKVVIGLLL